MGNCFGCDDDGHEAYLRGRPPISAYPVPFFKEDVRNHAYFTVDNINDRLYFYDGSMTPIGRRPNLGPDSILEFKPEKGDDPNIFEPKTLPKNTSHQECNVIPG